MTFDKATTYISVETRKNSFHCQGGRFPLLLAPPSDYGGLSFARVRFSTLLDARKRTFSQRRHLVYGQTSHLRQESARVGCRIPSTAQGSYASGHDKNCDSDIGDFLVDLSSRSISMLDVYSRNPVKSSDFCFSRSFSPSLFFSPLQTASYESPHPPRFPRCLAQRSGELEPSCVEVRVFASCFLLRETEAARL